jgi:hypothetical protein
MAKKKTLPKQKESSEITWKLKPDADVKQFSPTEKLLDKNFITAAILECVENNDAEGVIEVLGIYVDALKYSQTPPR